MAGTSKFLNGHFRPEIGDAPAYCCSQTIIGNTSFLSQRSLDIFATLICIGRNEMWDEEGKTVVW
jgi:hypothetical protein